MENSGVYPGVAMAVLTVSGLEVVEDKPRHCPGTNWQKHERALTAPTGSGWHTEAPVLILLKISM